MEKLLAPGHCNVEQPTLVFDASLVACWELIASRLETGILIPSDFANYVICFLKLSLALWLRLEIAWEDFSNSMLGKRNCR